MIFWDSSALVSLLVDEVDSAARGDLLKLDSEMAVWWATAVECESAMQRRIREGSMDVAAARLARERLAVLSDAWHEVVPSSVVRKLSLRLLRTHPLRAADSLQLASALVLEGGGVTDLRFACADQRLLAAAELEGLVCI